MRNPQSIAECTSIADLILFKYADGPYAGEVTQAFQDSKRDADLTNDYMMINIKCSVTKKIHTLVVTDIDIYITDEGTLKEKFHLDVFVNNGIRSEKIRTKCFADNVGTYSKTNYHQVECLFDRVDLREMDIV